MAALLSEVFEDDPETELPPDSEVAEDVDEEGVIRLLAPDGAGAVGPPRPEVDSATSTRLPKIKCQEIISCFGLKFILGVCLRSFITYNIEALKFHLYLI